MEAYSHFRAYLHSDQLRWSQGIARGRPGDRITQELTRSPLDLKKIQQTGYQGIYIDRRGFLDRGAALEAHLQKITGTKPIVSPDKELSFFKARHSINGFNRRYSQ